MASQRSNESVLIGDIEPHICPQRIKDGQMQHGTVNFFREDKGYGFITRDDGRDIFVHINDCDESVDVLTKGQRVEFEEGSNPRTGKAGEALIPPPRIAHLGQHAITTSFGSGTCSIQARISAVPPSLSRGISPTIPTTPRWRSSKGSPTSTASPLS